MTERQMSELLPCATCPWRIDKDATTIPRYNHEKACGLMSTVGRGDGFRKIMACHHSTDSDMQACRGYLAQVGWSNITVRLMLMQNKLPNPGHIQDACEAAGIELHPDYETVLDKLACSLGASHD